MKLKAEQEAQNEPTKRPKTDADDAVKVADGDKHDAIAEAKDIIVSDKKIENVDYDKIKAQIEYYFSDVNVVQDKFMLKEFEENDGYLSIDKLLTFSKLKSLNTKQEDVVKALEKSDLVEVDEDKKRVCRKVKIPNIDEFLTEVQQRSLHMRGFPTDYTFEQLKRFCELHGEVESVQMRNNFKTRSFKGNINVVFKNVDDAKKILAVEDFKCKDREIKVEVFDDYLKRKEEFSKMIKEKKKNK